MYKITVIIPAYNQEKLIKKAINSIPVRNDIETIVIDDGSIDNTFKIAGENVASHYTLIKNRDNEGVAKAVNKGYDHAQGEYIVLLGSDDYFYTDKFEEIIPELDGTDLVYFDLKVNNGDIWEVNNESKNVLCGSVKFMRKKFIGNIRCPEDRKSGEDVQFYQELLKKKPTEKFTHIVLKHYNHPREGSLTDLVRKGIINE